MNEARGNLLVQFYSQFIQCGDLVFDVGANIGGRTEAFVRLGATVVAIEPNAECCRILKCLFRLSPVSVESVAAGAKPGMIMIRRCSKKTMWSMSNRWIEAMRSGRFPRLEWDEGELVTVVPLDALIEKHGEPRFVKVDVEGFEPEVLAGLSRAIQTLSFEANPECVDLAAECIDRISDLDEYEFNVSIGESLRFEFAKWVHGDRLIGEMEGMAGKSWTTYADVYARRLSDEAGKKTSHPSIGRTQRV